MSVALLNGETMNNDITIHRLKDGIRFHSS